MLHFLIESTQFRVSCASQAPSLPSVGRACQPCSLQMQVHPVRVGSSVIWK